MVILTSSIAFAQTVKFGVKGGLNVSHLSWNVKSTNVSVDVASKSRASFYLGGFAESTVSDRVSLQAELQFSMNGGSMKGKNQELDYETDVVIRRFNFNIPVLVKFAIVEGLKLNAGGYFGLNALTQGKERIPDADGEIFGWQNFSSNEIGKVNTLGAGLLIGAEYNFSNGFFVEGRYNHGLTNAFKVQAPAGTIVRSNGYGGYIYTTQYVDVTAKDRFIQLGVGYKF